MKYKVGDRPVVREDLEVGRCYGGQQFVPDMKKYKGKVLRISKAHDYPEFIEYCNYSVTENTWRWTDEMFSGLAEEPKAEKASNKTSIVAGELVVTESYQTLKCAGCGTYLGRRGTIDGHDYDDTAGWKYCPFCGLKMEGQS